MGFWWSGTTSHICRPGNRVSDYPGPRTVVVGTVLVVGALLVAVRMPGVGGPGPPLRSGRDDGVFVEPGRRGFGGAARPLISVAPEIARAIVRGLAW